MNRFAEITLALVIVGATLAFGGVQPISYSLMEIVLFLVVLIIVARQTLRGEVRLPVPIWPVLFALLVVLQLIPLPTWLVGAVSPARLADARIPGLEPASAGRMTLSIYPHDTLLTLMRFLAYLAGFLIAARVFDYRKGKSTLLRILIFLGCFEAAYGIVQYTAGWQKIFTYVKKYDLQEATGTYINRNHFAGLLELILPLVLASAFYTFQIWSGRRHDLEHSRRPSSERSAAAFQTLFYLFLLVLIVVGVIFSRSRMGILVTVFTLVFMAVLAQLKLRRRIWMLGTFFFLVLVLAYGVWIGLNPVLARFERIRDPNYLQLEGRAAIWRDAVQLIRDFPLTGTGLGTFEVAYRKYQKSLVGSTVDHTHNDFLEFASDTGLIGVLILFLPIFYLLGKMVVAFLADSRGYRRAVILGCIGSTVGLLLHSITDFNLQIPANALIFATILGIGYKAALGDSRGEDKRGSVPPMGTASGNSKLQM